MAKRKSASSTRLDFLDVNSIISVSSTCITDTSDMGQSDNEGEKSLNSKKCSCSEGVSCATCATVTGEQLSEALNKALQKIDLLTSKFEVLEEKVKSIESCHDSSTSDGSRVRNIKKSSEGKKNKSFCKSSVITSNESASSSSHKESSKDKSVKGKNVKSVSKENRVEAEKARQLKVMKEKLKARKKSKSKASSAEDSSDDSLDMRTIRKKMTKKKKEECSKKLSARLMQAGAYFPEESDSTTSTGTSTGTDSSRTGRKSKSKKKVKSGADIKKRPVVKTELWPHTIANEDDGDEVSSENIGLAKFFSCFTLIMKGCGKTEAAGRAELLHAVSSVLECLPWADARTFHNLVMVKVEQGRLDWSADFSVLAEQYLDRKVRQNLRGKSTVAAAGTSYSNKFNSNKNFNKGFNSRGGRFGSSNNKSLYAMVCSQWNFGTCGYGDKCRKWHVCWSCAEAGKPGEYHRASSHSNAGGGGSGGQAKQRP